MFRLISAFVSGYPDSWFPWFTLLVWFVFAVHSFRAQIRLSTRLYIGQRNREMLNEMMAAVAVFKIYTFLEKFEVLSRVPCPAPYPAC